jgi:uncharacterized protein (DUF736 family)
MANQNDEWRKRELGALWKKKTNKGSVMLTGKITVGGKTYPVVVFPNKFKEENENAPDFRVYQSEPNPNAQGDGRANAGRNQSAPRPVRRQAPAAPADEFEQTEPVL